tara:strand:- start:532 stop:1068 length:537 start_codon:yes stop_codon:yes gene_type:complete
MAKTDSFFIRASLLVGDGDNYVQDNIDLGAYVDALGKSVLRIHNIEYEWACGPNATTGTPNGAPFMDGDKASPAQWQITTQSQTGLVGLNDRSVVGKGMLFARNPDTSSNAPAQCYQDSIAPQHFSDGYLVAVEQLFLGGQCGVDWATGSDISINIMLECTVETLSQSAAMALALSQQ